MPPNLKRSSRFTPQHDSTVIGALRSFGKSIKYGKNERLFQQGHPALQLIFIEAGKIKLCVTSTKGKEVVVGILGPGDFLGEAIIVGHRTHVTNAIAITDCAVRTIRRGKLLGAFSRNPELADRIMRFVIRRSARVEADLIDQLFNSTEKRLARALLLLARFGKTDRFGKVVPRISQKTLAEMVGTTRTRINFFMNRFRKLGFIEYNDGLGVSDSLVSILLHD